MAQQDRTPTSLNYEVRTSGVSLAVQALSLSTIQLMVHYRANSEQEYYLLDVDPNGADHVHGSETVGKKKQIKHGLVIARRAMT